MADSVTSSDALLQRLLGLHPRVIDLSLERICVLLEALGHPERRMPPVIHVAGTNGKGSLIAYLRAMLEAAGQRCHVYISPHLVRFHERIRIAGSLISEEELVATLEECERVNAGNEITYFEITTAAALLAFSRHPAEVLLLEVGLGGIYDATNVIDRPAATAITPIGIDHTQYLGETLAEIAANKAGIIKHGVPVIVGRQREASAAVIDAEAGRLNAPLHRMHHEWRALPQESGFVYESGSRRLELPLPALAGAHQIDNAATAIAVLEKLPQFTVSDAAIVRGLREVEWPARLQQLKRGPLVAMLRPGDELWLDGGHNEDCGIALAAMARRWQERDGKPLHVIFGMLTSKDAQGFLRPLAGLARAAHAVTVEGHAAYTAEEAAERARAVGIPCTPASSITAGLHQALAQTSGPRRVLICGSLYLAGTVLAQNF
ncbi:MAG: bifunctional folylpolyglutamate synthase/dihydrofolate synthase [Alphaproteobacteria bacterium]|jgi:dihydrofolate synthase/folylpolyglutamate synthase|nr:bifunctional folylpolyglutamate synthase/dihydrofolate synthase [Alphaproteobacteria bacterium]